MRIFINMADQSGANKTTRLTLKSCTSTTDLIKQISNEIQISKQYLLISTKSEIINLRICEGWPLRHYGLKNGSWLLVEVIQTLSKQSFGVNQEQEFSLTTLGSVTSLLGKIPEEINEEDKNNESNDSDSDREVSLEKLNVQSQNDNSNHQGTQMEDQKYQIEDQTELVVDDLNAYFEEQLEKMLQYVRDKRLDQVAMILKEDPPENLFPILKIIQKATKLTHIDLKDSSQNEKSHISEDTSPSILNSEYTEYLEKKYEKQKESVFEQKNRYILNEVGECGRSALHWAIHSQNMEIVSFLLMKHCNLSVETIDGYTPLQLATICRNPEILEILINQPKIDINQSTIHGTTLHLAVDYEAIEIIEMLLKIPEIDVEKFNKLENKALDLLKGKSSSSKIHRKIKELFGNHQKRMDLRLLKPNITKGTMSKVVSTLTYRTKPRILQLNPFKDQLTVSEFPPLKSTSKEQDYQPNADFWTARGSKIEERFAISCIDSFEEIKDKKWLMEEKLKYLKIEHSQGQLIVAFRHRETINKWKNSLQKSILYVGQKQYVTKIKPEQQLVEIIDDEKNQIKVHKRYVKNTKTSEKNISLGSRATVNDKDTEQCETVYDEECQNRQTRQGSAIQKKYKYSVFEMTEAEEKIEMLEQQENKMKAKQQQNFRFSNMATTPIDQNHSSANSIQKFIDKQNSTKELFGQEKMTLNQKQERASIRIENNQAMSPGLGQQTQTINFDCQTLQDNKSSSDDMRESQILIGSIINEKDLLYTPEKAKSHNRNTTINALTVKLPEKQQYSGNAKNLSQNPKEQNRSRDQAASSLEAPALSFRKKSLDVTEAQNRSQNISEFRLTTPAHLSTRKRPKIGFSDFEFLKQLGSGAFGQVYLCQFKEETLKTRFQVYEQAKVKKFQNKKFALKVLNKKRLMQKKQLKYAISETSILKKAKHPFIIGLHYCFQTPSNLYIALDYCKYGDLSELLCEKERLTEKTARFLIAQLILAIEYLHEQKILYRDLKPENILISEDGYIRLIDFGLSKENNFATSFCGSPAYLSPEMLEKKGHSFETDIYGIGCVLYEIVIGQPPFFDENIDQLFENIKTARLKFPGFLSKEIKSLLGKMLERDIKKRIGVADMTEIKKHQFFKGFPWEKLLRKDLKCPKDMFPEQPQDEYFQLSNNLQERIKYMDQDYNQNSQMINRIKNFSFERQIE